MDLKLFLLVGLCCLVRAQSDMRDKAMQAFESGQFRRHLPRFGRNFNMPPEGVVEAEPDKQLNEILNTVPADADELLEPGMTAGNKWHLPLDKQLLKYFWSRKSRST
ncbi:uncharacterized protein LOC110977132 [Acanthaster planci]|uniref:Uncharacterized protein LOC110977132 n=1 Tax=Acanthaster planci TaxID=133434 RepID=A0A8B7Y0J0_ACAPL|nr:uncharacterized protein LOC110977132 [Acanthaster planci]